MLGRVLESSHPLNVIDGTMSDLVRTNGVGCTVACASCAVGSWTWLKSFRTLAACVVVPGLGCVAWAAVDHIVVSIGTGIACGACGSCMDSGDGSSRAPRDPSGTCPEGYHECANNLCCTNNPG